MNRLAMLAALSLTALPGIAALPVVPGENQPAMLESDDPQLAANKKIAYDFFRIVLQGLRLEQAADYMHDDYMQHNPNADTGLKGFLEYFERVVEQRGRPDRVPQELAGLVAIQAEGDYVTLSFVREYDDPRSPGRTYTTTWFDMFRIVDGKIAEHWDSALVPVPGQ